jgi:hypothetical protein
MAAILYAVSRRIYPIEYEWGRVLKVFAIVLGAYFGALAIGAAWAKAAAFGAAIALLFVTGFFHAGELEALKSLFRARRTIEPADPVAYATERREDV